MNIYWHGFLGMAFYTLKAHEIDLIDECVHATYAFFFLDCIMHI